MSDFGGRYIDYGDQFDYEGVEDGNETGFDQYDYDYQYYDKDYVRTEYDREFGSPRNDAENRRNDKEEGELEQTKAVDPMSLLCKEHGINMLKSCAVCSAVKVVVDDATLQSIGAHEVEAVIPDTVSWIDGQPADKKVTLVLPPSAESYGQVVYFRAPQPKGTFEGWVKDFLFLSFDSNEKLMKNLNVEKILEQFKGHADFHAILNDVRNLLIKGLKNNRIAQRPLLLAISKLDEIFRAMRAEGTKNGMQFPAEAPSKSLFGPRVSFFILTIQR